MIDSTKKPNKKNRIKELELRVAFLEARIAYFEEQDRPATTPITPMPSPYPMPNPSVPYPFYPQYPGVIPLVSPIITYHTSTSKEERLLATY